MTQSDGARSSSTARAASSGGSDRTSSRARSSTRASGRSTPPPSSGDDGRVGAQEARRGGDERAVDHEVVQRHVVAAEPPAPRRRAAGLAEHPQVVEAGVAAALAVEDRHEPLGVVEDVLQAHRGRDGDVPGRRETRRDQLHRGPLLCGALRVHGQPTVVGGGVEPAPALGVGRVVRGDGADGHRALRVVQGVEPRARGSGHAVGDRAGGGDVADDGTHLSTVALRRVLPHLRVSGLSRGRSRRPGSRRRSRRRTGLRTRRRVAAEPALRRLRLDLEGEPAAPESRLFSTTLPPLSYSLPSFWILIV